MIHPLRVATGLALLSAALCVSACGGGEAASNNSAAALTVSANDFAIGPDASAVEIVGSSNVAASGPLLPMDNMAGNASGGDIAAPVAGSAGGAPGGAGEAGNSTGR